VYIENTIKVGGRRKKERKNNLPFGYLAV